MSVFLHLRLRAAVSAAAVCLLVASLLPASVLAQGSAGAADLSVSMIASPDPVAPGKRLTYRIVVGARGQHAASNVSVDTSAPAGTTFETLTGPPSGWTLTTPQQGQDGPVTATAPTLPLGQRVVFLLSVRVAADAADGATISNSVAVASASTDPTPADNMAVATTTVRTEQPLVADLGVSADYLQEPVPSFGQLVEFIAVLNNGPMAATDVEIRTPTPAGTAFVTAVPSLGDVTAPAEGESGDVVCRVDAIPNHRVVMLTVVLRVTAAASSHVDTSAEVSASSVDPIPQNNTAHASARIVDAGPVADVSIEFSSPPDRAATGSELTYGVVVHNDGPAPAQDVTALVPIPRAARFDSATSDRGLLRTPARGRGGAVGWKTGPLAPGDSASLAVTVFVRAHAGAPLVATALVTSRAVDTSLRNNAAAATTRVQSLGDDVLQWDPPDPTAGDAAPPTNVAIDAGAAGAGKRDESDSVARSDAASPICYNVYVSSSPNVQTIDQNLLTTVPADQTAATVPVAPGGSFFTVTAEYPTGESPASDSAGDGDKAGATLTSVKVSSSKIVAKGAGFTDTVEVLFDGIPFASPATVKGGAKAIQKGSLAIGETVEQYTATGSSFLVIVRNSDGGVSTWEYAP